MLMVSIVLIRHLNNLLLKLIKSKKISVSNQILYYAIHNFNY